MYKAQKKKDLQKNNGAVQKYLNNKRVKERSLYTINPDGSSHYTINGHRLTDKQAEELYPTNGIIGRTKNERIDPRQSLFYND